MKDQVKLKADVKDLLNQLVIKLKDIKELEVDYDNDTGRAMLGGAEEIYNEESDDFIDNPNVASKNEKFLFAIKELAKMSLENDSNPVDALEKFYTSTCW